MNLGHWRAGHWFGPKHADEYEVDGDEHGGMVAKTGRWFSEAWWDGHWLKHNRCGKWRHSGGDVETCHRRKDHAGQHTYSPASLERARAASVPDDVLYGTGGPGRRRVQNDRSRRAGDFKAYLEARLDDAETETRGSLVSKQGLARGITGRQFFSGRATSLRYASEELRDWFEANGRNLRAADFHRQSAAPAAEKTAAGAYARARVPY